MEVPGVIFLYSIVKYRKEIEEKEGKREREIGEIFQGRKDLQFLFIVHGNNYLFHICHNQSGNDNNI